MNVGSEGKPDGTARPACAVRIGPRDSRRTTRMLQDWMAHVSEISVPHAALGFNSSIAPGQKYVAA